MDEILGKCSDHLEPYALDNTFIHKSVIDDFKALRTELADHNIDLRIASGFRSYERQLNIWNAKVKGLRPVFDDNGTELIPNELSSEELLFSILRWSAIPGFSRHHYGTDFDIYDFNSLPSTDYNIQLSPDEYLGDGIFSKLTDRLNTIFSKTDSSFYMPYAEDKGAVAPEPWHISHKKTSDKFMSLLSFDMFVDVLSHSEISLKEEIINNAEKIYFSYICL